MDIMEEVVDPEGASNSRTASPDVGEWKVRPLADWVNLNFPLGMPEEEIVKAAAVRHRKSRWPVRFSTA